MTECITIFSSGTQFMDWEAANCQRCTKWGGTDPDTWEWGKCDLADAIARAMFGEDFTAEIAARLYPPEVQGRYVWQCPEVEWTETWKAEYRAQHGVTA